MNNIQYIPWRLCNIIKEDVKQFQKEAQVHRQVDEQIDDRQLDRQIDRQIDRQKYYSALRKKVILAFVTIWMDFEDVILSEISQRKANTV